MIEEPEFIYCVQCETPCYTFDWNSQEGKVVSALCPVCGNEESDDFQTEDEWDAED